MCQVNTGREQTEEIGDLLWRVGANHLLELGLLIRVGIIRVLARRETQGIGLSLLLLPGRGCIRLLMGGSGCRDMGGGRFLGTHLVATKLGPPSEATVMKSTSPVRPSILVTEVGVVLGRPGYMQRTRWRISLIWASRIRRRATLGMCVRLSGIRIAHWSCRVMVYVIKADTNRRSHQLSLGAAAVAGMATTSPA